MNVVLWILGLFGLYWVLKIGIIYFLAMAAVGGNL